MKKYKVITNNLDWIHMPLGSILERDNSEYYCVRKPTMLGRFEYHPSIGSGFIDKCIEIHPDWFEEITDDKFELEEKDWEVLIYSTNCETGQLVAIKKDNGFYLGNFGPFEEEIFMGNNILRVRRADNEIFSVGDKVTNPAGQSFIISKFYMNHDNTKLLCNGENTGAGHISINKIKHYKEKKKQPILTTEESNLLKMWANLPTEEERKVQYMEDNFPQFSKKDMIEFADYYNERYDEPEGYFPALRLNEWLKQRKPTT